MQCCQEARRSSSRGFGRFPAEHKGKILLKVVLATIVSIRDLQVPFVVCCQGLGGFVYLKVRIPAKSWNRSLLG